MRVLNKKTDDCSNGVYVGRPTKFGNPFVVGKDGTREEVVLKYTKWFLAQPELIQAAQNELKGKDLICWCSPELCHADVLLHFCNK